jgi:hypothetical protein
MHGATLKKLIVAVVTELLVLAFVFIVFLL